MNDYVRSPLNYIGGKYKLLPQILPLFPRKINTFVDLFCGGCNVGINVHAHRVVFNDILSYLIDLYVSLKENDVQTILNHIDHRIETFNLSLTNEVGYKKMRDIYNQDRNPLDLFVLVAYSFNHQIRFNNSHEFNNPFGRDRSRYNETMKRNLRRFIEHIQSSNALFTCQNYDKFDFSVLGGDDFVYCDPPYLITTGTYNDGKRGFTGWSEQEEKCLYEILNGLTKSGISFALSNVLIHKGKENDILRKWIAENNYVIHYLNSDYANSNYHTKNRQKTSTIEVLITNYIPKKIQYEIFG